MQHKAFQRPAAAGEVPLLCLLLPFESRGLMHLQTYMGTDKWKGEL